MPRPTRRTRQLISARNGGLEDAPLDISDDGETLETTTVEPTNDNNDHNMLIDNATTITNQQGTHTNNPLLNNNTPILTTAHQLVNNNIPIQPTNQPNTINIPPTNVQGAMLLLNLLTKRSREDGYDSDYENDIAPNVGGNGSAASTAVRKSLASATTYQNNQLYQGMVKSTPKGRKQMKLKDVVLDGIPVKLTSAEAHNLGRKNDAFTNKVAGLSEVLRNLRPGITSMSNYHISIMSMILMIAAQVWTDCGKTKAASRVERFINGFFPHTAATRAIPQTHSSLLRKFQRVAEKPMQPPIRIRNKCHNT